MQGPGDAEVGDHGLPARQHDVLRLDVAMDDAVLVGVLQGAADFAGDLERGVERKLLFPREPLPERLALGERHHVVEQAVGLSRVVERENVGVLERRGDLDLAEEPLAAEDGRQLGLEQLDGDPPAVLQVLGEKDDRHPAVAELPLDPVSIAERRRELLEEVHGCPFTGERCLSNRWRQATSRLPGPSEDVLQHQPGRRSIDSPSLHEPDLGAVELRLPDPRLQPGELLAS